MSSSILLWLAGASSAITLFGWVGYPIILRLLPVRRSEARPSTALPTLSVVIATREPPEVVQRRVANVLAGDFPTGDLQLIVALDASVAGAFDEYRRVLAPQVDLVASRTHGGKAAALNAGVRAARNDLLVFADSRQDFATDALSHLARAVATGPYAAVTGRLVTPHGGRGITDWYWSYELRVRRREARIHSVIGVTGAIYAMHRPLWREIPDGVLCDDVLVAMWLILGGHRIGYCAEAVALERRRFSPRDEFRRKVRTQTGNLQLCVVEPQLLYPGVNPVWLQFVCHKLIRIMTPVLLLLAVPGAALLLARLCAHLDRTQLAATAMVLSAALLGALAIGGRRVFRQAKMLLMLCVAPLPALYFAMRGRWSVWTESTTNDSAARR
jgi:cellulose synthase/poly-beta-1,6-N-acetylglucosamine synthase-like glycosyltransferase